MPLNPDMLNGMLLDIASDLNRASREFVVGLGR
jgi:hypothetical protein